MYIGLAKALIEEVEESSRDFALLKVDIGGTRARAVAYPGFLVRPPTPGQWVLVNTTAVDLGLGSGGVHFVVAGSPPADSTSRPEDAVRPPGHVMKLRYTPLQFACLAAEEESGPAHDKLQGFSWLEGTPVVCCELHSQVPAVAAGIAEATASRAKVTYVYTDGGALPVAFSRLVGPMREAGLVSQVISCGQAFGGDAEAVNIYSALATAAVSGKADVIICGMGPGIAGTGTALGFSGVEQGQALNAAASLDGIPVAVPRLSLADPRDRHYGISHHTLTVLGVICLAPCILALPRLFPETDAAVARRLQESGAWQRHLTVVEEGEAGLDYLLQAGIRPTTMGRGVKEDPEFFLAAAAAGRVAGKLSKAPSRHPGPVGARG